jgi:hypothetical protein
MAAQSGSDSLSSFVSTFLANLTTKLPFQMINMPQEELARVLLVGYFQRQPFSIQIQVLYPLSFLMLRPEIHFPAQSHKTIFSGAESVFSHYANLNPESGTEAINFVHQYIRDCADSSSPDCAGIGGHIHIAELTPDRVRWIIAPELVGNLK